MNIQEYSVEELVDPTGIIQGKRFEFLLYIVLEENDELYVEEGTGLRVIFAMDGEKEWIASNHFFERSTDKPLDFELEDEEKEMILQFCKSHYEQ